MKQISLFLLTTLFLFSCRQATEKVYYDVDPNNRTVKVLEVTQSPTYTYLRVSEGNKEFWMAVALIDVRKGETLHFTSAMEMEYFHSKELDRSFDRIYFVSDISKSPVPLRNNEPHMHASHSSPHGEMRPATTRKDVSVAPREGAVSIAELYAGKNAFNGQTVKLTGEVVRYNPGIMNRNWVHIQDGTADGDNYSLTVTTTDNVAVGDLVTIEGTVALGKDFGSGYYYALIVEEAKVNKVILQ